MIFKTYHTCDGGENNPVQFTNITFSQLDKETIVMNGHISIKKQLKGEIQVSWKFYPHLDCFLSLMKM